MYLSLLLWFISFCEWETAQFTSLLQTHNCIFLPLFFIISGHSQPDLNINVCELRKSKRWIRCWTQIFRQKKSICCSIFCTSRLFWMKSAHMVFMVGVRTMLYLSVCNFRQMASRLTLPFPTWPLPSSVSIWIWLLLWHAIHSDRPLLARSLSWHRISHREQSLVLRAAGRHCCAHSHLGETVSLDLSSLVPHSLYDPFYFSTGLLLVLQLYVCSVLGLPPHARAWHHWAAHEGRASWFHHGEGSDFIYGKVKVIYKKKKSTYLNGFKTEYFKDKSLLNITQWAFYKNKRWWFEQYWIKKGNITS